MDNLNLLKNEIICKKQAINEMVLKSEKMTAPEIVRLSVELDILLNELLSANQK